VKDLESSHVQAGAKPSKAFQVGQQCARLTRTMFDASDSGAIEQDAIDWIRGYNAELGLLNDAAQEQQIRVAVRRVLAKESRKHDRVIEKLVRTARDLPSPLATVLEPKKTARKARSSKGREA
jgi:hypothetical protein